MFVNVVDARPFIRKSRRKASEQQQKKKIGKKRNKKYEMQTDFMATHASTSCPLSNQKSKRERTTKSHMLIRQTDCF